MVSKLRRQGMPADVEGARRWRDQHLNIAQRKRSPAPPPPAAVQPANDAHHAVAQAHAALAQLAALGRVGARLLASGAGLATIEPELRQALRAVPPAYRDCVRLDASDEEVARFLGRPLAACEDEPAPPGAVSFPLSVWGALVADVLSVVREDHAEMVEAGELQPRGEREPMNDDEVDEMVGFWYAVACGELRVTAP
jgi:hypothetical protein